MNVEGEEDLQYYDVTAEDQCKDPAYDYIMRQLQQDPNSKVGRSLSRTWLVKDDGRLWRHSATLDGEPVELLAVPRHSRGALLRRFHHLCHRGHTPLVEAIRVSYYWPRMSADCLDFVNACTICAGVKSRKQVTAPVQPSPTPDRPFNVIHVDHKGPLPRSGRFTNILVVTCALTRFTLYIPVESTTADDTVRHLMARVFCVFGFPLVIRSDNGPAFVNGLQTAMSKFFGYRHVPILPYNAQANGIAEASVKRIKTLLDRHTDGYTEWHRILPLAQLQLNSHVHNGTGVTPFMALFGRPPTGIEFLENPSLLPSSTSGSEFLIEIKQRMQRLHKEIKQASDDIKKLNTDAQNLRRLNEDNRTGSIIASTPDKPSYVRILRGSQEGATYLRKHGHGDVWKYRYKVLEVTPHAVRLEVPKDGSVPAISQWQLIRRCEPSLADEIMPSPDDPKMTDMGVPLYPNGGEVLVEDDPDKEWEIDKVVSAEKVGNRYRLWIKWKGIFDPTPMWKSELEAETSNEEVRAEIKEAVDRCKILNREVAAEDDPEVEDVRVEDDAGGADEAAGNEDGAADPEEMGRGRRNRKQATRFGFDAFAVYEGRCDKMIPVEAIMLNMFGYEDDL